MSKFAIKNAVSSLYFVDGKGLAGSESTATQLSYEDAQTLLGYAKRLGLSGEIVEVKTNPNIKQNADGSSFAVNFVRAKDLQVDGSIKASVSKWNGRALNPTSRRFATKAEAQTHGARFVAIEGHLGYFVTTTKDAVNSYVNAETGKTNPVIGRGRVNR